MHTVLETINLSTEYLEKKGIESPRINAELLLAHILKCKRLDLYLSFERPLDEIELNQYREFIKRRSKFEPLQYIIGSVEFFGIEFKVNSSVLIPRPETEILVEAVIDHLKNNQTTGNQLNNPEVLDIGTGSGNVAISIAKNFPQIKVIAIDVSSDGLFLAKRNAEINGVIENINFIKCDILKETPQLPDYGSGITQKNFDVIVSNPPYISLNEFPMLQPELKMYEPKNSLTDYLDGFNFYRIISEKSRQLLKPGGRIFFELGKDQAEQVKKILCENSFTNIILKKDYLNIERVISAELN